MEIKSVENILNVIRKHLPKMSPMQAKVAEFILSNPETFGLLSITDIAEQANVSPATIIRFCRTLQYGSFKKFSADVQKAMQQEFTSAGRFAQDRERHRQRNGISKESAMHEILESSVQTLLYSLDNVSEKDVKRCIQMMTEAKRIYLLGDLISEPLIIVFRHLLGKVTNKVLRLNISSLSATTDIAALTPDDLIIAVAYPRYPAETVSLVKLAQKKGSKIVSVTNSEVSPLASLSDLLFAVPVKIVSYIDILSAPLAFLSGLALEYSRANELEAENNLSMYDAVSTELKLFAQ